VIQWRGLDPEKVQWEWGGQGVQAGIGFLAHHLCLSQSNRESLQHGHCGWCAAHHHLITHCVYDEAEWLFGMTATLIPSSPQGPS
jgi:hypothetical protein